MKLLRITCAYLLLAGMLLTSRALYLHAKAEVAGLLIRRAWSQTPSHGGEVCRPWPWADIHPVARLRIPRLTYDEIVLDKATARTLAFGPAVALSGARVGAPGNVVVVGHRTSWFRKLEGIETGDRIELQWFDAARQTSRIRVFIVEAVRAVDAADLLLAADEGSGHVDAGHLLTVRCGPPVATEVCGSGRARARG